MIDNDRKKLMILGCGHAQLDLIMESKNLGYMTVACDNRPDMKGAKIVDKYYQVDYTDIHKVFEIAKKEHIDGIISNSEVAMVNVAYIAQEMNLVGNSVESIESFVSKSAFRKLQRKARAFSPEHYTVTSSSELLDKARIMGFPIIVKPTVSTGTQGTTKIDKYDEKKLTEAFYICRSFSRNKKVSVEQYVSMSNLQVVESDVVVIGDDVIWDGMMWTKRSPESPMLPETYVFPMNMIEEKKEKIKDTVETILRTAGIKHGEYNVEGYFTDKDEVFIIEINPRQGGNHIPQLIEQHTGINFNRLLVSTSVGDMSYYNEIRNFKRTINYVTLHVVYAREHGILKDIHISKEIQPYVKWIERRVRNGENVHRGTTVFDGLACIDLQFDSHEIQQFFTDQIERHIYPIIDRSEE